MNDRMASATTVESGKEWVINRVWTMLAPVKVKIRSVEWRKDQGSSDWHLVVEGRLNKRIVKVFTASELCAYGDDQEVREEINARILKMAEFFRVSR